MNRRRLRRFASFAGACALAALGVSLGSAVTAAPATASGGHAQIQGSGSSWAANAVNQWISDVTSQGLQVVFTGSGSATGRTDFANQITDFGVSDIGYQGTDPGTGALDSNCVPGKGCRAFAYEPIVAGGTSFPYHISVGGRLVRNLRLSGETLTKIFTYNITNWDDPEITKDNNGQALPSLHIVPVVHSEGSGSTAQFTTYMNQQYPSLWQPFAHLKSFVEYYPSPTGGQAGVAQNGSDGVMNFISSSAANGSIGYDEYSYPLAQNYPVVALLNQAGYFTLPTQYNVAVALQHAVINTNKSSPNYLLQNLNNVYVAPEPQVYPMSSYSYFLIPTGANDPRMTTAKRQTLADYLDYAVCQGQKEMGPIGYSPLPSNLVQASFAQTTLLGQADPAVNVTAEKNTSLASCDNPTFYPGNLNVNRLAQIAPLPLPCQKLGQGPCTDNSGTPGTPGAGNGGGTGSSGSGGTGGTGGTAGTGTNGSGAKASTGGSRLGAGTNSGGSPFGGGTGNGATDTGLGTGGTAAYSLPQNPAAHLTGVLAPLAVLEILAVIIVPPTAYFLYLARRRPASGS